MRTEAEQKKQAVISQDSQNDIISSNPINSDTVKNITGGGESGCDSDQQS